MKRKKIAYLIDILKNSSDHIFICKPDFEIVSINELAKNLLGGCAKDILGESFLDICKKGGHCVENILNSHEPVSCDVTFRLANGAEISTAIEGISFGLEGEKLILIRVKNGKTNLKELIETSLNRPLSKNDFSKKIEHYFNLIQKEAKLGIWEIHLEDMKVYWSDELYDILGVSKDQEPVILERSSLIVGEDREFVGRIFEEAVKNGNNYKITYRIRRPDGEIRYLDEHAIYIKDDFGSYLMGFDIDVTEREKYQKRLIEQTRIAEEMRKKAEKAKKEAEEANRARSIFLSNISHEIRTLLNAILGYSQILKQERDLSDRQRKMVESILIAGGHLLDLINDILDITKMEMGKNRVNVIEFNLTSMFKSLYQIFKIRALNKNISWKIVGMPKEDLLVYTDKTKLFHILLNLIGNAIKFTEKGSVELIFRYKKDNRCYFEIRDTGVGIEDSMKSKIFEPFTQNEEGYKRGGTGLGLTIAYHNVKILGGDLKFESKVGEGTRFFFEIPCGNVKRVKLLNRESSLRDLKVKEGERILALVADDVEDNRVILKEILERMGFETVMAADGEEAVALFERHAPDIAFLDIKMPKKEGDEAAKEIKRRFPWAFLVAITASSVVQKSDECSFFDEKMTKPVNLCDLEEILISRFGDKIEIEQKGAQSVEINRDAIDKSVAERIVHLAKIGKAGELRRVLEGLSESGTKDTLIRYLKNFEFDKIERFLKTKEKDE